MPAGYSGTPLAKKLGIQAGFRVLALGAPADYADLLAPLPEGVVLSGQLEPDAGFIHFFTKSRETLASELPRLKDALARDGILWLSWPKKSSGVATDLDGNAVRALGLAAGLVDVKVCAVDAIWSGHKFVYRAADR